MNFSDEMDSVKKSDRSLTPLLIQLEEVEEQIDGLQQSRLELIEKIVERGGSFYMNDVAPYPFNPVSTKERFVNPRVSSLQYQTFCPGRVWG